MSDLGARLAALAVGLCHDAGIGLEVAPDGGWSFDPVRRVIRVSGQDLETRGTVFCAGVLAHEVGHFFVSRYHLLGVTEDAPPMVPMVINTLEDPRCETWIRRRYPGTRPWLTEVSEVLGGVRPGLPDLMLFCFEAAGEQARGWRPSADVDRMPRRVVEALEVTRDARRRYAEILPSPDLVPEIDVGELTTRYRSEVWPRLSARESRRLPARLEQEVRLRALEALDVALAEIMPIAESLMEGDEERLAEFLEQDERQRRRAVDGLRSSDAGVLGEVVDEAFRSEAGESGRVVEKDLRRLARRVLEGLIAEMMRPPLVKGEASGGPRWPGGVPSRGRSEESPPEHPPAPPLRLPTQSDSYSDALRRIGDQVDRLTGQIERVLLPRRRLHDRAGYRSGYRVDLRRLMAFDADPRRYDELWMRKSVPDRRDVAVSLLVDLSGSMAGDKAEAALMGTVLLAETLNRLGVSFSVDGFQDVLIPLCAFGQGLTSEARRSIGEIPAEVGGTRPGGRNQPAFNDDGPCLLSSAEKLRAQSATDRVLIVISDGAPAGRDSGSSELRQAVADLTDRATDLELIGVGLGPGTDHVTRFYPKSVANVPLDRFAAEIGRLVEEAVVGTGLSAAQ